MEELPNWIQLWRELVEAHDGGRRQESGEEKQDVWEERARTFDANVKRRWQEPDSSRTFIAAQLAIEPEATFLDLGAGTGAWTIFLAQRARQVTAVDPSPAMLKVLRENVAEAGLTNVEVVEGAWPHVDVPPHDYSLCSHAMYGIPDFELFVRKLEAATLRRCYLLLRAPAPEGVMAKAARHLWGHPHDSPNFQVAYNALLQLGIFANVLMEDSGLWDPWKSESLDVALGEVKRRLGLTGNDEHDAYLRALLEEQLTKVQGEYVWPRGVRSALVYWDVSEVV